MFATFLPAVVIEPRVAAELREGARSQRVGNPISPDQFAREIAEIRRLGYAAAVGSPIPGINAVSAPVFDHTGQMQLALTLIGPAGAVDVAQDSSQARRLLAFTTQLSAQLGYDGGTSRAQRAASDSGDTGVHLVAKPATEEASPRRSQKRRA